MMDLRHDSPQPLVRALVPADAEAYREVTKMQPFLESSAFIDWNSAAVIDKARDLAEGSGDALATAKACFEFVRDEIRHSGDYGLNPVTLKASEVLEYGTGFCYSKSHLLAALLRANGIPAGLCYQRLTIANDQPPFCLHGLNAVFLEGHGWYRLDARGNKPGIIAEFCPPEERLAFRHALEGEGMFPQIWAEPMELVVRSLEAAQTCQELADNLPDLPVSEPFSN